MATIQSHISSASALLVSRAALLAWLAACAGCALSQPANEARLINQIDALIGDARCSKDEACLTIGIGAKPCGGPSSYRAWSSELTDAKSLHALVARHREERLRDLARTGEQSNCALVPDPGASCQRSPGATTGRCELRPAGIPGGSSQLR